VAGGKSSFACAKAIDRLPSAIDEASHVRW
jgi:hypothetical protein